jgi:hypothetical protein
MHDIDYDEYSDELGEVIMSTIGYGKQHTNYYINNPKNVGKIDYFEGFEYLLNVTEEEYWEIKAKYDPFIKNMRKFNL